MTDGLSRHRVTVDEYCRMAEDGRLDPDARIELIEGEIVEMAPMRASRAGDLTKLMYLFIRCFGGSALCRARMPLRLDNYSEPEPDLALLVPREDFYEERHPTAADVFLLIEVNDSSSGRDPNTKISLYARNGVPEVWILDLKRKRLDFYRAPRGGTYTDVSSTANPGVIALPVPPGITVDLSNWFDP